jgi:hypothetical protein
MINFMDQESFLKSQNTATKIHQQQNMKLHRCSKKPPNGTYKEIY